MATTADTVVRARIDSATKEAAARRLSESGLSISEAIRLMMTQIAAGQDLPYDRTPNKATATAMAELMNGKGKKVASIDALFDELGS
ncbi:type II toxin-antitoxin system RelB/DinJ family antitoxin [Stutzerimonas stutzeri]